MLTRSKRSRMEQAEFVTANLQRHGVDKGASSRFSKLLPLFRREQFIPGNHKKIAEVYELERDRQSLAFVFDEIGELQDNPEFFNILKRCIKDPSLPDSDQENSAGRDAQFHLLMTATCKKAGLSPRFAEPDIVCDLDGKDFGIAAKRVKGLSSLVDRIKEGASQLQRHKVPGVIAIDVSLALNQENRYPRAAGRADDFMAVVRMHLAHFVGRNIKEFRRAVRGNPFVYGLLLFESFITADDVLEPEFLCMTYGVCTEESSGDRRDLFERFRRKLRSGLYNPQSFSASESWRSQARKRRKKSK